jgi:ATP-dependent RNA helicase DOB1
LITKLSEFKAIQVQDEPLIKKKMKLKTQLSQIDEEIRKIVVKPENIVPFLVPGRLIHVKTEKEDWGWGILVSFSKQRITAKNKS